MKKVFIATLLFTTTYGHMAQAANDLPTKEAYKAMLNLFTYNAEGKLIKSDVAFYVDNNGSAVCAYSTLKDATRAEVVDAKGKKYNVSRILGANATTDLVKFRVDGVKDNAYYHIVTMPATTGQQLTLQSYTTNKKTIMPFATVDSTEAFNALAYYHISAGNDSHNYGCPLIDQDGSLVGVVQQNVEKNATKACAIDARFINALNITAASAFNSDLAALKIPRAIPDDKQAALNYLFMLPTTDSLNCTTAYADFIAQYPDMPDGYVQRAQYWAGKKQLEKANNDYATALSKSTTCTDTTAQTEDAVHYAISSSIYRNVMAVGKDSTFGQDWNLTRAEHEADLAYKAKPMALYMVQKGNCQYAARNYQGAYTSFITACHDAAFATSETYFSAARSLEMAKGDNQQVIALLDSCINRIPQNNNTQYAQFYLERSQRLLKAERYRDAVADYNQYEQMIGPRNLTDRFYDLRSQAEEKAHMYQQALDDLHTAIAIAEQPLPYQIDEAALLLNVGEYQRAIDAAKKVLTQWGDNADCYKIIGVAHGELKHKAEALKYLQRAKDLGDKSVDNFIEKYK